MIFSFFALFIFTKKIVSLHIRKKIVFMMGSRFFPILCVLFLLGGYVFGQDTILMGTNNHQEIVSNYCVLYADNGPGNPHSPAIDVRFTMRP